MAYVKEGKLAVITSLIGGSASGFSVGELVKVVENNVSGKDPNRIKFAKVNEQNFCGYLDANKLVMLKQKEDGVVAKFNGVKIKGSLHNVVNAINKLNGVKTPKTPPKVGDLVRIKDGYGNTQSLMGFNDGDIAKISGFEEDANTFILEKQSNVTVGFAKEHAFEVVEYVF